MAGREFIRIPTSLYDDLLGENYSDAEIAAYLGVLCKAELQSPRGRFANDLVLLGHISGRHRRKLASLKRRGVLVPEKGSTLYVDGWDELEEKDWTARDRVARMRARKNSSNAVTGGDTAPVTPGVTPGVTAPVTPRRAGGEKAKGERRTLHASARGAGENSEAGVAEETNGRVQIPDGLDHQRLAEIADFLGQHRSRPLTGLELHREMDIAVAFALTPVPTNELLPVLEQDWQRYQERRQREGKPAEELESLNFFAPLVEVTTTAYMNSHHAGRPRGGDMERLGDGLKV